MSHLKPLHRPKLALTLGAALWGLALLVSACDSVLLTKNTQAAASNDASLADLGLAEATLSPAFSSSTLGYTASVANTVTSVTVKATTNNTNATLVSGTGVQALQVGSNTLKIVVGAQDGSTRTYTITVTRAAPTPPPVSGTATVSGTVTLPADATGKTFWVGISSTISSYASVVETTGTVSGKSFSYSFSNVPAGTYYVYGGVDVAGLWVNGARTMKAGDFIAVAGATSEADIPAAPNTVVPSSGTLAVNLTTFVYSGSNDATLSALSLEEATLSPAFSPATTTYTASVANSVASVTVMATKGDAFASITSGTGTTALAVGTNTLKVVVTAENGSTKTYTLTVTRAAAVPGTIGTISVN